MTKTYRIAVIPGDGIGKEVIREGVKVVQAAADLYDFSVEMVPFDFSSADYYVEHGTMLPADWFDQLHRFDAILFGAVGWPELVPDHVSLWGSLLQFRRHFDQYVSLRPVKLLPGVRSPLAGRVPGDVDFYVVRENTEGEYSSIGGKMFEGTEREVVVQETVMSRVGVDRILKYAFDLSQRRPKKHLTSATKSNGIAITMPYWDERVQEMSTNYPEISVDKYHIDILTANFVLHPDWFDVVVASNLFGDILSDLGPACTGTHRYRTERQHQPGTEIPQPVRTGPRVRPFHRREGHRQSARTDLERRHDAGTPRRNHSRRGDSRRLRKRPRRRRGRPDPRHGRDRQHRIRGHRSRRAAQGSRRPVRDRQSLTTALRGSTAINHRVRVSHRARDPEAGRRGIDIPCAQWISPAHCQARQPHDACDEIAVRYLFARRQFSRPSTN